MPLDDEDLGRLADAVADRLAARLADEQHRLLDRKSLATRLGVSERTVGAMDGRGELPAPAIRTGGIVRWSWTEVVRHLGERRGRRPRKGRGRYERREAKNGE